MPRSSGLVNQALNGTRLNTHRATSIASPVLLSRSQLHSTNSFQKVQNGATSTDKNDPPLAKLLQRVTNLRLNPNSIHDEIKNPALRSPTTNSFQGVVRRVQADGRALPVGVASTSSPDLATLQQERAEKKSRREKSRMINSLSKFKGDWSYDWRPALKTLLVQQSKLAAGVQPVKPEQRDSEVPFTTKERHRDVSMYDVPSHRDWSTENFLEYTKVLTHSRIARPIQGYPDNKGNSPDSSRAHSFQVQRKLEELFSSETLRRFRSTAACEEAIRFFYKHNMQRSVRLVLSSMDQHYAPMRTSTFNLILWSTAFHADLRSFTYFLEMMAATSIPINNSTWCAFVRVVDSKPVKLRIIREMKEHGILEDAEALQSAVAEIVDQELQQSFISSATIAAFFNHMDTNYGAAWLSEKAANRICEIFCTHGQTDKVLQIMNEMEVRAVSPSYETLTTLLEYAIHARDVPWAQQMVSRFENKYRVRVGSAHLERIFRLGYAVRGHNVSRLAWQYACHRGMVTKSMHRRLLIGMLGRQPGHASAEDRKFTIDAAEVISGIGGHRFGEKDLANEAALDAKDENATPAGAAPLQMTPAHVKWVKEKLQRDMASGFNAKSRLNFPHLFADAVSLDHEWSLHKPPPSRNWMLRNRITLPVEPLRGTAAEEQAGSRLRPRIRFVGS